MTFYIPVKQSNMDICNVRYYKQKAYNEASAIMLLKLRLRGGYSLLVDKIVSY